MNYEAHTTKQRYVEIKKNPLLFCHFTDKTEFDITGRPIKITGWFSCDSTITLFISENKLEGHIGDRQLFIIGDVIEKTGTAVEQKKTDEDIIYFNTVIFDPSNSTHWSYIFNDCFYNFSAGNYKHNNMSLVWALYTTQWSENIIENALSKCNSATLSFVANNINSCLFLFSIRKQNILVDVFKNKIPSIRSKIIPDVENVLKEMYAAKDFSNWGFYDKIDRIINFGTSNEEEKAVLHNLYKTSVNCFIHYKYWKETPGHKLYNYAILHDIYSYVNVLEQMDIIKRYLHDVRHKIVNFDEEIIQGFRSYKYPVCVDGRYFIERPGSNIMMMAPMFSDAILTLYNTKGERLQSFNGILDLAIKNSNSAYPNIDFGVKNFLPCCDGGLVPNSSFYGFIHFDVHYSLDETLLTKENLIATANYILNRYANQQMHWCCTYNNDKTLTDDERNKCQKLYVAHRVELNNEGQIVKRWDEEVKCDYVQYKYYNPPRWKKTTERKKDQYLSLCIDNIEKITGMFTFENVSIPRLEANIRLWSTKFKDIIYHNDHQPEEFKENEFAQYVIRTYYRPKTIDIYSNKSMFYSSKKSLLGLWTKEDMQNALSINACDIIAQKKESEYIYNITFNKLKEMCPDGIISSDHITIPYDNNRLYNITVFFHYKRHQYDPQKEYASQQMNFLKFLVPIKIYDNIRICTPKVAKEKDKVSNLPFFWCRSAECFCNVLEKQTLDKEENWKSYTLYHAAEIIGYKLIDETPEGNIANDVVANFAAELRQAERLYKRLVCRSCGHMIFSTRGSILNGSRFFNCLNRKCAQYKNEIYLSQCNHCKKGLIDSRDSKRCPNNWVICPECLSCCNDGLFQAIYNNHLRNGFVPQQVKDNLEKGHNNKDIFFCPKCGTQLEKITIVSQDIRNGQATDVEKTVCPTCNISYEENLKKYYS